MKTRNIFHLLMLVIFFSVASPSVSTAAVNEPVPVTNEERIKILENRLEEIRSMDTKKLSRGEKRALRKEVRNIKEEMAAVSGGVYLSVGAIIIIALLLILLL